MIDSVCKSGSIFRRIQRERLEAVQRFHRKRDVELAQRIAERLKPFNTALPFVVCPSSSMLQTNSGQERTNEHLGAKLRRDYEFRRLKR